jgi:hypothetical protein
MVPDVERLSHTRWYATRYKDLKNPLLVTFFFFLVV